MRLWLLAVLVAGAAWAQDPIRPTQPLHYDLSRPLCRQMQLSPDLIGALTPPSFAVLGVPAAVQVSAPVVGLAPVRVGAPVGVPGGLAPVHTGTVPGGPAGVAPVAGLGGLGAVRLDPALPAPTTGGQSAILLARVRAGDQGPELEAALRKLPAADLVAEVKRCPWWSKPDQGVADQLLAVLMDRRVIIVEQPESVADDLVLPVAECLRRRSLFACVPLYERLLAPLRVQPADGWVPALYGLARFYRSAGLWDKSVGLCRDVANYTTSAGTQADLLVEAARLLAEHDDEPTALVLYRRAKELARAGGDRWVLGMAVLDEVRLMTKAGRQTEARASLERQAGQFDDCPVGIIMYGDLSALYFADGDIAAAERHARTAQRLFEAHSRPESCADSMDTSRFILDRIAEAAKTPVAVALLSGDVVERGEHRDYRQVYRLTALRPVDVAVTTTATGLAWGFDGPWERTWGQCTRELRLTLADYRSPDAAWAEIRCDGMAPLTVRVPRKRNFGDPP